MLSIHHRCARQVAFAVALIVGVPRGASADVITLGSVRDNTLYQDAGGALSNGAGEFFFAGNNGAGLTRRGLVRFDLAGVPGDAVITSVTLTLHMSLTTAGAMNVGVHRVLADWGEGTSDASGNEGAGAASTSGDATWIHSFYNTSTWSSLGGDFAAAASAVTSVDAVGTYSWSSQPMLADVQQWIASPAANFGWLLRGDESMPSTAKRFDTRENSNASFRPTLTIEYVPAPGAMTALAAGFVLGLRRRRRAESARGLR